MAEDIYYPPLDVKTIRALTVVRQLVAEHPSYWLNAPYGGDVQMILTNLFKTPKNVPQDAPEVPVNGDDDSGTASWEFLARESKTLYMGLKNAGVGLDGNELMTYYKTSSALLEKLLAMQERANNLKQISDFYQCVLEVMEDVLTVDQRTAVMEKLKLAMQS